MRPVGFLAAALLLYGGLSVPAPAEPGWIEGGIAVGLLLAAGWPQIWAVVSGRLMGDRAASPVERIGTLVLWCLALLGLARGGLAGWNGNDIVRDLASLGFLFLPVFLGRTLRQAGEPGLRILGLALAGAGVLFSLRWWQATGLPRLTTDPTLWVEGRDYLLNSLAAPFATIALLVSADDLAMRALSPGGRFLWRSAAVAAGGLIGVALGIAGHRGALGAVGVGLLAGIVAQTPRPLGRLAVWGGVLGGVLIAGLWFPEELFALLEPVIRKTRLVGLNGREQELMTVLDAVTSSGIMALLGTGWGGLLANPAVDGWRVSFVHNLPAYMLLKGGVVGLLLLVVYAGAFFPALCRLLRERPALGAAILPTLLVGIVLHTSFKYLCFGALLTLLAAAGETRQPAYKHKK